MLLEGLGLYVFDTPAPMLIESRFAVETKAKAEGGNND